MYTLKYERLDGGVRITEPHQLHVVRDIMDMCERLGFTIVNVIKVTPEPAQSPPDRP